MNLRIIYIDTLKNVKNIVNLQTNKYLLEIILFVLQKGIINIYQVVNIVQF